LRLEAYVNFAFVRVAYTYNNATKIVDKGIGETGAKVPPGVRVTPQFNVTQVHVVKALL